jgi:prepilin-type N-terminal cleavage/methylation domain-containing protein
MKKIKSEILPKLKFFSVGQTVRFTNQMITSILARLKPCPTSQIDGLGTASPETQKTHRHKDFLLFFLPETRNTKHETVVPTKPETQNSKQFIEAAALCGKNGFTIIEIIVSLLIFGILSTLLFSTFMQMQRNINKNRWKNQLTEEGVNICNIIQMEIMGAREIYYADKDSISFLNQEGTISSFTCKDSLLFKTNKNIVPANIKIISFEFTYYLKSDFIDESSKPIYFLPVDPISLEQIKVVDWKIKLQKGRTAVSLKTGAFIRNIRQQ